MKQITNVLYNSACAEQAWRLIFLSKPMSHASSTARRRKLRLCQLLRSVMDAYLAETTAEGAAGVWETAALRKEMENLLVRAEGNPPPPAASTHETLRLQSHSLLA